MPEQTAKQKLKWEDISKNIPMSEQTIRLNQNKVNWPNIFQYQTHLSSSFYDEFRDKIVEYDLWDIVSQYGNLSQDFIFAERANLNWDLLFEYQKLSDRVRFDEFGLITDITGSVITVSKQDVDLTGLSPTSVYIYGSDTPTHVATHTIDSIAETETDYLVTVTTVLAAPGSVLGFIRFLSTGTGNETFTFLSQPELANYLRRANNPSNKYRKSLIKGQFLPYQFIIDNESLLDMSLVSECQDLHEGFIMIYANESTLTGNISSIQFDWQKLTINQDLKYLLITPNYSWVDALLNYQLLNRWNHLTRDFIYANYTKLPIPDIGIQRSLSEEDIDELQSFVPIIETAKRKDSVKFQYTRGQIVQDLKNQNFDFEGESPIGYVAYRKNGSVKPNHKFDFSQKGIVSTPHVNLNQQVNSGVGIKVSNGDDNDDITNTIGINTEIAKVKIPIINRTIDQPAKGKLMPSNKNNFSEGDRLYLNDGDNRHGLEFRLNGNVAKTTFTLQNSYDCISDTASNTIQLVDHPFTLGDRIQITQDTPSAIPTPLVVSTDYYVIPVDDDSFSLALSAADAIDGTAIVLTSDSDVFINRMDSVFTGNYTDSHSIHTGLEIILSGTIPSSLSLATTYYAIKTSSGIRIALTLEKAKAGIFETFTTSSEWTLGFTVVGTTIPVDLESPGLISASQMATVLDRLINNLYKLDTTDSAAAQTQTWYTKIKTGTAADTTVFTDYSSTGTFDINNNRFTLLTNMQLREGDPVTLQTSGTLPSGLAADTIYYVHKLSDFVVELCSTYENAISATPIPITDAGSGTHTAYPLRVDLNKDLGLVTGNKITVTGLDIPTNLALSTDYFVNVISPTRIEFCSSYANAKAGTPIKIRKTGSNTHSIVANDINFTTNTGSGIARYIDGDTVYVELVSGTFEDGNTWGLETVTTATKLININSLNTGKTLNLTSNLDETEYSKGNQKIEHSTTNPLALTHEGMVNGFEKFISDENAQGVGVVLTNGTLRAYSVEVIDPNYREKLGF